MNKTELRMEWEQRIAKFLSSGQSASKWCAANEVNIQQFWYWKKRIQPTRDSVDDSPKWVALEMDDSVENPNTRLVVRVGQVTVEVEPGFDPKLLADVVRTLQSVC
jgi:hypothetical protein